MVFDCGTLSERTSLETAIEAFKRDLNNNQLDVLFISHLDDDHVNGIKNLLENLICKRIYLPYLTPIHRLYVAIRHSPQDTNDFDDFISFLQSPHRYLLNIEGTRIEKIIYVIGNSEENSITNSENIGPIDPDRSDFEIIDKLSFIPEEVFSLEMNQIGSDYNNVVEFRNGNNSVQLSRIWEFYLYHKPASDDLIDKLIEEINKLYSLSIDRQLSQEALELILKNKGKLGELRKKFKKLFKSINRTGLIIQHKPIGYQSAGFIKVNNYYPFHHYFNQGSRIFKRDAFHNHNLPDYYYWGVTLLTGDICLNQIEDSDYIKRHLESVLVFQVPHHGSYQGWDKVHLKNLNYKGKTSAVINFGYGNKYGHPSPIVLSHLDEENFDIRFCNQFEFLNYQLYLSL